MNFVIEEHKERQPIYEDPPTTYLTSEPPYGFNNTGKRRCSHPNYPLLYKIQKSWMHHQTIHEKNPPNINQIPNLHHLQEKNVGRN